MEILIVGTIEVPPDQRAELLETLRPLVQKTREEEPGCLAYAFTADTVDAGTIQVLEHWRDEASLAAHFEHPNFFASKEVLGRRVHHRQAPRRPQRARARRRPPLPGRLLHRAEVVAGEGDAPARAAAASPAR